MLYRCINFFIILFSYLIGLLYHKLYFIILIAVSGGFFEPKNSNQKILSTIVSLILLVSIPLVLDKLILKSDKKVLIAEIISVISGVITIILLKGENYFVC